MTTTMANSVQMNTRFMVGLLAIIGVTLYCLYSAWNSGAKTNEKESVDSMKKGIKLFKTWKHREFADIPQTTISAMKNIEIQERHLEFTPQDGQKVRILVTYIFAGYACVCTH